ncbi:MAG: putative 2OG-Fe(II) oxygenase [Sphingomicrobium sp.]
MINQAHLLGQLQRIQLLHQAGRAAEAWTDIAPLRAGIADHGQALRLYALVAQGVGRVDPAAEALRRIIAIEREPPEIVGALADMLGTAGRHDEALALWTRLTMLLPGNADALLNRAISAANASKQEIAIAAADAGLKHFPGHARLLAVKAMALKNVGRVDEALPVFDAAIAADPSRPLTRHNQAVALRAAHRFDEACAAFAASERLGLTGAQFHTNWAAAALEAGDIDGAVDLYARALDQDPGLDEALKGLTRIQIEFRGGDTAFDHYRRWADRVPGSAEPWVQWSNALIVHNRLDEAADVAERGLIEHPGLSPLAVTHAFGRGMVGDAGPWLDGLERLLSDNPGNRVISGAIPQLALRAGRPERAAALLEADARADPANQVAWSLLSIAWRLLDDPREAWLCDYDRLVMVTEAIPIDGDGSARDYAAAVATALDPLHRSQAAPGDQSLRGGTQTSGALFDRRDPAIQMFRAAVLQAAERAIAELPDDPSHPFLRRKARRLDVAGSWSVRLSASGHHIPHVHHQGWMSSAYYARLPEAVAAADERHQGWIQFGAPPAILGLDLAPRRVVEPQSGQLVLFPSYLWHGTIPFEAGDRLTAAFDFVPR